MQKLYCYINESGQDTKGTIFIVAIAVVGKERDELIKILDNIEIASGKKRTKWNKTKKELKEQYFAQLIQE